MWACRERKRREAADRRRMRRYKLNVMQGRKKSNRNEVKGVTLRTEMRKTNKRNRKVRKSMTIRSREREKINKKSEEGFETDREEK